MGLMQVHVCVGVGRARVRVGVGVGLCVSMRGPTNRAAGLVHPLVGDDRTAGTTSRLGLQKLHCGGRVAGFTAVLTRRRPTNDEQGRVR